MRIGNAFEFVGRCAAEADAIRIVDDFRAIIRQFGFTACAGGSWVGLGTKYYASRLYFADWPTDWIEIYQREKLFLHDPIVTEARRSMAPFLWSEVREKMMLTEGLRRAIAFGDDYGWREIFAVPIHGPMGYEGLVSMAAREDLALAAADRAVLEIVARAVHYRCWATPGLGATSPERPPLTSRQIDCLRWVAAGKSDSDIALLLGISTDTVHFHIEEAKRRLGVRSRVQAVAHLVLDGTLTSLLSVPPRAAPPP